MPVLALGSVQVLVPGQHLLLRLVLLLLLRLLMQFHVGVPAVAGLDAVSAILCAACLVPGHFNCSWCRFLLWVSFGP